MILKEFCSYNIKLIFFLSKKKINIISMSDSQIIFSDNTISFEDNDFDETKIILFSERSEGKQIHILWIGILQKMI